jgi:hypothetical protein
VLRDGVELKAAAFDTALPVDPGKHVIEVSAPGHDRKSYQLSLTEGERATRVVEPGAPNAGNLGHSITSDQRAAGGSGTRTLGWVFGGVGVAGIALGAVTGMMVLDRKSVVDDNCDADKRCNPEGADAADAGRTLGTISGVSFAVGAVALAAGVYLVLSSDTDERPTAALALGPAQLSYVRLW